MRSHIPLLFVSLLAQAYLSYQTSTLGERSLPELSDDDISTLISIRDPLESVDISNPSSHLSKILIPRAAETENNTLVRNYIASRLKALKWHVEEDEFTANTPLGRKRFTNVIATKDPTASRRVIMAAHFDSKYYPSYPENQFVGATDSAAPCAMLLDLAESLNTLLDKRKERFDEGDVEDEDDDVADTTLQLVFFDGEEAFVSWTDTDSVYGARHLAEKWASTYIGPHSKRRLMDIQATELSGVEHLILLDLLGAPDPQIRSYFLDTAWLFDVLVSAEKRLGNVGAFAYGKEQGMAPGKWRSFFMPRSDMKINMGYIGDDHVPFIQRGVGVLHLIPDPFPHVWHSLKDDASTLDLPTMRRWNLMLRVFMAEYLHLRPRDLKRSNPITRSESELVS